MKVIQIRGSNGAGKTTTVRQFVQKNNLEIEEILIKGKKTYITTNKEHSIVVLGRYDKKTGGCDLFDDNEHVFNTIVWAIINLRPQLIIFEGLIYSFTFKFASKISDFVRKYNYKYTGISLFLEPELALERIYKRNGGKQIKEQLIFDKTKAMVISHKKLAESGYNVKMVNTGEIKEEDMYKILENELNEK